MSHKTDTQFLPKFNKITKELPFNPAWENTIGYFDHAVEGEHKVVLQPGEEAKSMDHKNRKMIFIGTILGPIVVFQRYRQGIEDVYYCSSSLNLKKLGIIPDMHLTDADLHLILNGQWVGSEGITPNFNSYLKMVKRLLNSVG